MSNQTRLEKMKGKVFLYNTRQVKILNYKILEDYTIISTDKKIYQFPNDRLSAYLDDFLPVIEEMETVGRGVKLYQADENFPRLKNTLLEQIELVKKDKKNIPQANSVISSIKAYTDIVKTEMLIDSLNKK